MKPKSVITIITAIIFTLISLSASATEVQINVRPVILASSDEPDYTSDQAVKDFYRLLILGVSAVFMEGNTKIRLAPQRLVQFTSDDYVDIDRNEMDKLFEIPNMVPGTKIQELKIYFPLSLLGEVPGHGETIYRSEFKGDVSFVLFDRNATLLEVIETILLAISENLGVNLDGYPIEPDESAAMRSWALSNQIGYKVLKMNFNGLTDDKKMSATFTNLTPGRTYRISWSTNLQDWTTVWEDKVSGTSKDWTHDPGNKPRCFMRMELVIK